MNKNQHIKQKTKKLTRKRQKMEKIPKKTKNFQGTAIKLTRKRKKNQKNEET